MSREDLIAAFEEAKKNKTDIYVAVTIPGQDAVEYIINKNHSLDNKLDYYCKAYDENCVHSMNDRIKIVESGCIYLYIGE